MMLHIICFYHTCLPFSWCHGDKIEKKKERKKCENSQMLPQFSNVTIKQDNKLTSNLLWLCFIFQSYQWGLGCIFTWDTCKLLSYSEDVQPTYYQAGKGWHMVQGKQLLLEHLLSRCSCFPSTSGWAFSSPPLSTRKLDFSPPLFSFSNNVAAAKGGSYKCLQNPFTHLQAQ